MKTSESGNTDHVTLADGLHILLRTAGYCRFFKNRLISRLCLITSEHFFRLLLLPWPIKVIIDHVILGEAIKEGAAGFPAYIAPFVMLLRDLSAPEIMSWMLLLGTLTVTLLGVTLNRTGTDGAGFGKSTPGASGPAFAYLIDGHDSATRTENQANFSASAMGGLLGFLDFKIQLRFSQAMSHLLRSELTEHILKLPVSSVKEHRIGDSAYRVLYDSTSANIIVQEMFFGLYSGLLTIPIIVTIMLTTFGHALEVIVVGLLVGPVTFLLSIPFAQLLRRRSEDSREAGAVTTTNIEEGMTNVLAIQSLGGNKQEKGRFKKASSESFIRYRKMVIAQLLLGTSATLAFVIGQIMFFLLMSGHVIDGTYSAGDYFVALYYFFVLSAVSFFFGFIFSELQEAAAGMARVFELLDTPAEKIKSSDNVLKIKSGLSLNNVSLSYADGRTALKDINLKARIGQISALVGPTGAGKTSLTYLIPALLQPTHGRVEIDGVNVNDISMHSLRQQVSYIFQETQLSSQSILQNIRYGNPTASIDEVQRVAKVAGAHDFISTMAHGYHTKLGTVMSKLSVGQKQRIAIARGLLKRAQILILDEPTSALDPETEAYLVDALQDAAKNRIVIIIAHRLSTISKADIIYFLDNGEIREQGSHLELMSYSNGHYKRFVGLQAESG